MGAVGGGPGCQFRWGGGHTLDEAVFGDEEAGGTEPHQHQQLQEPEPMEKKASGRQGPQQPPAPRPIPVPVVELSAAVSAGAHIEEQGSLHQVEAGGAEADPVHG